MFGHDLNGKNIMNENCAHLNLQLGILQLDSWSGSQIETLVKHAMTKPLTAQGHVRQLKMLLSTLNVDLKKDSDNIAYKQSGEWPLAFCIGLQRSQILGAIFGCSCWAAEDCCMYKQGVPKQLVLQCFSRMKPL